jgi:hypothetical protein
MNAKTEEETLIVEMSLDAIAELLDKKLAEQRAHLDAHIARLEGMLLMAARSTTAPTHAVPASPVAPTTQVSVNTLPAQVPLYSIQNGAYAGWWCYYTADRRSHPVLSREQAPAWDSLFGTRGSNPVMAREQVHSWEAHNAAQIEQMRAAAREWAQSQAPVAAPPAAPPAAPTPAPVPEFNDNIPDFA